MGVIFRNGVAYGGDSAPIEAEKNEVLIGDGEQWAEGSDFYLTTRSLEKCLYANYPDGIKGNKNATDSAAIVFSGKFESDVYPTVQTLPHFRMNGGAMFTMNPQGGTPFGDGSPEFTMTGPSQLYIHEGARVYLDGTANDSRQGWTKKTAMFTDSLPSSSFFSPFIAMHGGSFISVSSDGTGTGMPMIGFTGGCDFQVSDKPFTMDSGYKWNGKANRYANSSRKCSGPIVHFSGNAEFEAGEGSWAHFCGVSSFQMTDESEAIHSGTSYVEITDNTRVQINKNAYIEASGSSKTKIHDDSNVQLSNTTAVRLTGTSGIDIGSDSGQIYLTTDNGRDGENIWAKSYCIQAPDGNGKESKVISNIEYTGNVLETAKNLSHFNWTRFDASPNFLQQGKSSISYGSKTGHDIIKWGTDVGSTYLNMTSKGYSYVKVGVDSDGFLGADITPGAGSETYIKFGANRNGRMQIYLTGSIFKQMCGVSHFEMHNASHFIMRGDLQGTMPWDDTTGTARILTPSIPDHAQGDELTGHEAIYPAPLMAMYDEPCFVMRGTWEGDTITGTYTLTNARAGIDSVDDLTQDEQTALTKYIEARPYFKEFIEYVSVITSAVEKTGAYKTIITFKYKADVPENWTGRAKKFNGHNPLFEMIENSEIVMEGDGSIKVTSDDITINGVTFTKAQLQALKDLIN